MFQETLDHLRQASLTGQVQGRVELTPRHPRPRGTVDVGSVAYQETRSGSVVKENGSVEQRELDTVTASVPGIGVTTMNHLTAEGEHGGEGGQGGRRDGITRHTILPGL